MKILPEIHESFKYLKYSEGNNYIELDIERGEKDAIIYVPNKHEWDSIYNWACGRREYIIDSILNYVNESDSCYIFRIVEF